MAKTSLIQIPVGLDTTYAKSLQSGDRFVIPHIKVKRLFTSRSRKKGLTQKSLFVQLAPVWAGFDDATRLAWNNAGAVCDLTGFKLFVQDTAVRIANDLSGYATPSTIYQSKVGKIEIEAPAVGFTILQLHPQTYYINKKVVGTRSEYYAKLVQEDLSLPVDIAISYKSDLSSAGDSPLARFFIIIYSNYQGRTIENVCEISFSLSHSWERLTASISGVVGQFRGYTAFIQLQDVRGTLLFDNVDISHGGLNWARDPFCNSIATTFTKAFYQIPKNWAPEEVISGAFYGSVYHNSLLPSDFHFPASISDDSSPGGVAWLNPSNASKIDGSFSSLILPDGQASHFLKFQDFGFNIPLGATITGILLDVFGYQKYINVGESNLIYAYAFKTSPAGIEDNLDSKDFPVGVGNADFVSFGGVGHFSGLSLSPADVNNSSFGIVLLVSEHNIDNEFYVDGVRLKILYTI